MKFKYFLAVAAVTAVCSSVQAQKSVESTVEVDFVSHYLWRGIDKGGITVIPSGMVSWQGASLKLSGTTGLEKDDPKEINITLGYKLGPVNIGVTDYWTTGLDYEGRDLYFDWDPVTGAHRLEGNLGIKLPWFSLQGYTFFWGNDYQYQSLSYTKLRKEPKRAYSTYIELNIPFYMGGIDWDLTAGMTPFEGAYNIEEVANLNGISLVEKKHFYSGTTSCILASLRATKRLEFGDMKVPVFAELNTNPYMRKAYFVVGLQVQPFK